MRNRHKVMAPATQPVNAAHRVSRRAVVALLRPVSRCAIVRQPVLKASPKQLKGELQKEFAEDFEQQFKQGLGRVCLVAN